MRRELCWSQCAIAAFCTTRAADGCREEIAAAEVWEDLRAWCPNGEARGGSRRCGGSKIGGIDGCSDGYGFFFIIFFFVLVLGMFRWVGRAASGCRSGFGRAALGSAPAWCTGHVDGRKGAANGKGEL